ncbi:hypothetical protein ScPMuIL_001018 [Solemya velum]
MCGLVWFRLVDLDNHTLLLVENQLLSEILLPTPSVGEGPAPAPAEIHILCRLSCCSFSARANMSSDAVLDPTIPGVESNKALCNGQDQDVLDMEVSRDMNGSSDAHKGHDKVNKSVITPNSSDSDTKDGINKNRKKVVNEHEKVNDAMEKKVVSTKQKLNMSELDSDDDSRVDMKSKMLSSKNIKDGSEIKFSTKKTSDIEKGSESDSNSNSTSNSNHYTGPTGMDEHVKATPILEKDVLDSAEEESSNIQESETELEDDHKKNARSKASPSIAREPKTSSNASTKANLGNENESEADYEIKIDASIKADSDVEKSSEVGQSTDDAGVSQLNTDAEASTDSQTSEVVIKEEPMDTEFDKSTPSRSGQQNTPSSSSRPKRSRKQKQPQQSVAVPDMRVKPEPSEGDDSILNTETTVVRPKSPTKSCSVMQEDLSSLSQALVETGATSSDAESLYETGSNRMVCAVGSKVALVASSGEASGDNITCYWCNFCPFKTEKKDVLVKHIMEHRFHCMICSFQSYNRVDVIHHSMECHPDYDDTAKSLLYCTFLPDFLNGGMSGDSNAGSKRKLPDSSLDAGPIGKHSKLSANQSNSSSVNIRSDRGECAFEMEVDEVDDPNDPTVQEHQGRIMVPSGRRGGRKKPAQRTQNRLLAPNVPVGPPTTYPPPGNMPVVVGTTANRMFLIRDPTDNSMSSVIMQNTAGTAGTNASSIQSIASNIVQQNPLPTTTPQKATPLPSTPKSTAKPPPKKTAGNVTVSSGLCWKCGYCDFITLRQAFLKTHLKTKHGTKAHKYVAMLISSQEEMEKIKLQDAQVLRMPESALTSAASLSSTITAANLSSNRTYADTAAHNAEEVPEMTEEEMAQSNEPLSYKCAHCNFTNLTQGKVKDHMFMKHPACVYYALDMRAVKLKQRQYLFFCLKRDCDFSSKDTNGYLQHTETCTPWTEDTRGVDEEIKRSLEFTKQFAQKIAGKTLDMVKNLKNSKNAEYSCIFCSYVSNNNTRLKKHVLTNHSDRDAVMKDLQALKMNKKEMVYFCRICLWETRTSSDVGGHMASRHKDAPIEPPSQITNVMIGSDGQEASPILPTYPPASVVTVMPTAPKPKPKKVHIDESDMQRMRDDYVAHHVQVTPPTPSRRPRREAAAKAQRKFLDVDQYPPIYSCIKCNEMCFGITLMRKHILEAHPGEALLALDIDQTKTAGQDLCCLCPDTECNFLSVNGEGVIAHATDKHGFELDHPLLIGLKEAVHEANSPPPSPPPPVMPSPAKSSFRVKLTPSTTSSFLEAYECLYCMGIVCSTVDMMKEHFEEIHAGEDIIFRDCAAWRQHLPSRTYMCSEINCSFTSVEQKDFTLHGLAHKQAVIFECSLCQWFTTDETYVPQHKTELHNDSVAAVSMQITLDLDGDGNIMKKIGNMVIKQEPV